jgi:hypothetical protein
MFAVGSLTLVDGSEVKVIARRTKPTREQAARLALAREEALRGIVRQEAGVRALYEPGANLRFGSTAATTTGPASVRI